MGSGHPSLEGWPVCDRGRHGLLALPGFLPRGVREAMGKRLNTRGRPTGTVGTQRHIHPSFPRPSGAPCSVQPVTDPSRDSSRLEPPPKPVPTPHGHDWHCCPTPATSCHSASSAACLWGEGRGDLTLVPETLGLTGTWSLLSPSGSVHCCSLQGPATGSFSCLPGVLVLTHAYVSSRLLHTAGEMLSPLRPL